MSFLSRGARSLFVIISVLAVAAPAMAFDPRPIPDEYESSTGISLAMNNAGAAATDPHSAIRLNPALLSTDKTYSVSGGYHWPTAGRDFYQGAVVDAKTSAIAAGLSYTGFTEDFKTTGTVNQAPDSPVIRRGVLALSMPFGNFSGGIGGTYVEANCISDICASAPASEENRVKGFGLNLGLAGALSQELRVGASAENATNKKIADYAPKTFRAGAAYSFAPTVIGYLDYRQRDRVVEFEAPQLKLGEDVASEPNLENHPEQMVLASLSAQIYDIFRVMGSYGQALSDNRRCVAGGLAIVNKSFNVSYTTERPYMNRGLIHSAVSVGIDMAM